MGAHEDGNAHLYCPFDGIRLKRWRGIVLDKQYIEGQQQEVCDVHAYVLDPSTRVWIGPSTEEGQSKTPCPSAGEFVDAPEYEYEPMSNGDKQWLVKYGVDVDCPSCNKTFAKLIARKDGKCYLPAHGMVEVAA